jgi:hypothetical protein
VPRQIFHDLMKMRNRIAEGRELGRPITASDEVRARVA